MTAPLEQVFEQVVTVATDFPAVLVAWEFVVSRFSGGPGVPWSELEQIAFGRRTTRLIGWQA